MTPEQIDELLVEPMARAMCAEYGDVFDEQPKDHVELLKWNTERLGQPSIHPYDPGLPTQDDWLGMARAALDAQRTTLKSVGLFIGPEVATPEMENAMALRGAGRSSIQWGVAVAEWQRGGGA